MQFRWTSLATELHFFVFVYFNTVKAQNDVYNTMAENLNCILILGKLEVEIKKKVNKN